MDGGGLGGRLRTLRESATLTREALAERSGVSVRTIAALELGTVVSPRVSTLGALADGLSLDPPGRAALVALARRDALDARSAVPHGQLPVPRELPPAPPALAGRESMRDAGVAYLVGEVGSADGVGPRVWVASGPPGVGKTTLALQVAHAVAPRFPDGQLFVSLGGGTAPSDGSPIEVALRRILTTLGLHPAVLPSGVEALAALMRSRLATSRILLVLDDAPGAVDLTPLVPGSPGTAVLVTARTAPTALPTAMHQPLGALGPADAVRLLAGLAGAARVDSEPDAARRVAELCDGLPVALKVAGSRLAARPSMTFGQVAARLVNERTRLDLLSGGGSGVRASLDSAYDGLDDADRVTLHILGDLGTPTGPTWVVAAALEVDLDRAIVTVERLVESGLVDSAGAGVGHSYRLHDLTRILAGERAEQMEPAVVRADRWERVLVRWRELAHAAALRLPILVDEAGDLPPAAAPPEGLTDLLADPRDWFATTSDTLARHVASAVDVVPVDRVWPALTVLWHYWRTSDTIADVAPLLERVRAGCVAAGDRRGEAFTSCLAGVDSYGQHDPRRQIVLLERGRGLFADLGDATGEVKALVLLAGETARLGSDDPRSTERSLATARAAVELAARGGQPAVIADAVAGLARIALAQGRHEEATDVVDRGRDLVGAAAPPQWIAQMDWVQGIVRREQGDLERARGLLERAHTFVADFGDRWGMAAIERELGEVLLRMGERAAGERMLAACIEHAEEIGLSALAAAARERLEPIGPV